MIAARLLATLTLAVAALGIGPVATVLACTCMQLGAGEALANAQVAFTGVVARVEDPNSGPIISSADPIIYTFAVEEALKGEPGSAPQVVSARESASCGMTFAVGQRWTVYADVGGGGRLETGLCSGNELLAEDVPVPDLAEPEAGVPIQLLLLVGVGLLVVAASAFAFTRRSRAA
ncbi:MAG TPA: hypothetical protein VJA85_01630 [Candidatus Limnocylindria bacterium]|nr:hypothetical protein [Candidatus Limnocylindria bacterium]